MAIQLLVATTNHNKVDRIKKLLLDLPIDIVSLSDLRINAPEPEETGLNCVSIAAQKALAYLDYVDDGTVVLAQDDTISFEGVSGEDNPGTAIKEPVQKMYGKFTDENAIEYYTKLAKKYGDIIPMTFSYGHAIAYKQNNARKIIKIYAGESKLHSQLVSLAYKPESVPGYFLAAIMKINNGGSWKYYTELTEEEMIMADSDLKDSILNLLKSAGLLINSKED